MGKKLILVLVGLLCPLSLAQLPTPPVGATAYLNLQVPGGSNPGTWTICSGTACAGGSNTGSGSAAFAVSSPSLSGGSMSQTANGNGYNVLYYRKWSVTAPLITNSLFDTSFYIPSASNTIQALEFDPDLYDGSYQYFLSVQCEPTKGWALWNMATFSWDYAALGKSCGLISQTDEWHRIQLYGTYDQTAHTYTYQTLVVDGATIFSGLNQTYSASALVATPTFIVEHQIDNNSSAVSNVVYYDNTNVWTWGPSTSLIQGAFIQGRIN